MRIAIGADHAGFPLKEHLVATLVRLGHTVEDRGTFSDAAVDYPPICADVARLVASGAADRGVIVGGSGQGEQITANKIRGIRATLCSTAAPYFEPNNQTGGPQTADWLKNARPADNTIHHDAVHLSCLIAPLIRAPEL